MAHNGGWRINLKVQTKLINNKEVDGMSSNRSIEQKRDVAEQLWLLYFNSTLYDQKLITEAERNRLHNMITNRRPSAVKRWSLMAASAKVQPPPILPTWFFRIMKYNITSDDSTNF